MTISTTNVNGTDRDQVLQDIYSNIETLSRFVRDVKARTVAECVQFDRTHIDDHPMLIDLLIAEHAVESISTLVTAEIDGGYVYASAVPDYGDDEEIDVPVRRKKRRAAK